MKPCAFGHPISLARLEQKTDVTQAMGDHRADSCLVLSCLVLSVQGLSSVLNAVSRTVEPKPEVPVEESSPRRSNNSSSPDPFDRISSMARSSLAGSLKLLSASTRGVGDAVIQAGTVVEELTGGFGQVTGETGRRLYRAVSWRPAPCDTVSCFIIHGVVKPTPIEPI